MALGKMALGKLSCNRFKVIRYSFLEVFEPRVTILNFSNLFTKQTGLQLFRFR